MKRAHRLVPLLGLLLFLQITCRDRSTSSEGFGQEKLPTASDKSKTAHGSGEIASGLFCSVKLRRIESRYAVALQLVNLGEFETRLRHETPLWIELEATAFGKKVSLRRPPKKRGQVKMTDLVVQPGMFTLRPTTTSLAFVSPGTPIARSDPFLWTVEGEPRMLDLRATGIFEGYREKACVGRLTP